MRARYRIQLRKDIVRQKCRIKSLLAFYNIDIPAQWNTARWSRPFLTWLWNLELSTEEETKTLHLQMGMFSYIQGMCAGISEKSSRYIISQIRSRKIHRATGSELPQIAASLSSKLRGWINYIIGFYPSALDKVFLILHNRLARWITNKYKKYRRRIYKAKGKLKEISRDFPNLFEHWKYGYTPY